MLVLLWLPSLVVSTAQASDPYHKLSWFIQVTDVHISAFQDSTRVTQFRQFVKDYLRIFQPALVICSGDLTDGKTENQLASGQVVEEWATYMSIVANRSQRVPWLDIRGNHDTLNVFGRQSQQNLFTNYSESGRNGSPHSYKYTLRQRDQSFNFFGLDASWEYGMPYPFNFIGDIPASEQAHILRLKEGRNASDINIYFGHYPSSVVTQSQFLRTVTQDGLVYLSGHLHDLAFLHIHNMFTLHGGNNLELELVDWKNYRGYRLLAVDQGFLSFTDLRFGDWPAVLLTFPKDSEFLLAGKEPLGQLAAAAQIRLLVFSDVAITSVSLVVGNEPPVLARPVNGGPLYLVDSWDSSNYRRGIHSMTVTALDAKNRSTVISQTFVLDGVSAVPFHRFLSALVLESSFATLFQVLFVLSLVGNILVLVGLKVVMLVVAGSRGTLWSAAFNRRLRRLLRCSCLLRKLIHVCSYTWLFWPFLGFTVYMAVGPWVVGSLIEDRTGAIFAWGAVVAGHFVPVQTSFMYYFLHFTMIHPSLILATGHIIDWRTGLIGTKTWRHVEHCSVGSLLVMGLGASLYLSLSFWLQFGPLGFLVGPLRTWSFIFYGLMLVVSWRVRVPPPSALLLQQDPAKKVDPEQSPRHQAEETEQSGRHVPTLPEDEEAFFSVK